jgi:glycosyltransferase involved in cell wall biosynthesis
MRLVFVNRFFHPDHSATSQILTDLCFALAARGHEVHVVTSRLRYDDATARFAPEKIATSRPAPEEVVSGVMVHRIWTSRFGRGTLPGRAADYLTFYLSALWRLARLADRNTILVAKTDPPMISVVAALVARATGARLVNWTQDLFPEVAVAVGMRVMRPAFARSLAAVRDWSLRCAVRNVAIGEHMRARLLARGLPDAKIAVIHNWADGAVIVPEAHSRVGMGMPPYGIEASSSGHGMASGVGRQSLADDGMDANPLRREWGLGGKFVVGYSGNLGRVHEFATVLDAAAQLADREDIVFLFIGAGHRLGALKAEAARRHLANVQFRPYQPRERLAQSLGACDAHLVTLRPGLEGLVLPSKFYGIIAAGRPVLFVGAGEGEGEIADLVRAAECGAVFGVGEAVALADCIQRMAADRTIAKRWGENGRRLFDERFNKPIAIDRWERLLADVAQV